MGITDDELSKLALEVIEAQTEKHNVETKDCREGLYKQLWQPITAFSNSPGGGIIILGVEDDTRTKRKTIVGGLPLEQLQHNIISLLETQIINKADYQVRIFECSQKKLLAIIINETPKENKPCYYSELGMDKGACVRVGNINRRITEEELRSFLRYTPAYNFDKKAVNDSKLTDLNQEKIKSFLTTNAQKKGRTFDNTQNNSVLRNIGVIVEYEDLVYPTVAGMMIFSHSLPQDFDDLSRYLVRCVRYAGNSSSTPIIDKKDVYGTLDLQVDEVLKFIQRNIKTEARIEGSKRVERYEFPDLALREIVVNALVHRDYSNKGTYVQVAVFTNRIEVSNPGTLPPGVTIENLKNAQFSRNNVIAQVMRDLDYMEEFGRGIDLIYSQMLKWNLPEPLFKNVSNVFRVTLLGKSFQELNERQVKIWDYLQDKNQITAILAHSLFPNVSRKTINSDLKKMQDIELIELKGSSNSAFYIPRY